MMPITMHEAAQHIHRLKDAITELTIALRQMEKERDEARAELALDRVIKDQALAELDESQRWIRDAHARTDEARAESARRLAVLKDVEWAGWQPDGTACPCCYGGAKRHEHDCPLAAELAQESVK